MIPNRKILVKAISRWRKYKKVGFIQIRGYAITAINAKTRDEFTPKFA